MSVKAKRRNRAWMGILLVVAVLAQIGFIPPRTNVAEAADNGLAQKPYMGWSSYSMQVYDGPSGNWISEDKIKLMSDTMHEKLQSHGYEYINIDAGWNGSMDEYGRPVPSTEKYPNGFENLIDYVHANGQKVGIYMIPGISPDAVERDLPIYGAPGCTIGDIAVKPYKYGDYWNLGYKIDFSNPCAQKWVDSVADLIASWGVDFVKFDSVTPGSGHNDESIDARGDVKAWSEALSKHGIWLELSWALDHNYVDYWKKYANGWRIDWDVEAYDPNIGMTQWANIARLFPGAALWWRDAGPGGWNDFDSLNVGNGETSGLTKDERQTAATLWAASAAQFYTGDDLTNLDDYGLSLYTNDEVIAVNQAGHPIHPVSMDTDQQAWYANNGDGTYTVALFNLGSKGARVGVKWSDIGLSGTGSIRDLWSHKEMGSSATGIDPLFLEPHASRLFKVTVQNGTSIVNDDDTGMKYTGEWTRNGGNELVRDAQDLSVVVTDSSGSGSGTSVDTGAGTGGDSGSADGSSGSEEAAASSYTVTINDDDPSIAYANKWGHSTGRSFGDYMGDVHYGEPDGSEPELTYTFEGTGIELLSEQSTSSGKIDIYIDGNFHSTVDSYGNDQVGQHSVFSVADLPQGTHTLRAVRNAGGQYYFLFDAFKVTADTLLGSPSATSFNKDAPADITIPLNLGASSFTGISNGTASLQSGTDYTVSSGVVTIKSSYLAQQASGQSAALSFKFAGGAAQTLSVAVSGTSISPVSASFDKRPAAQADLAVTLTLGDSNELTGVKNGANALTAGTDYTVDGNVVRIAKSYLASLPLGDASLSFEFSGSSPRTFSLTVLNSASPGRYVFVNNDDPGIRYTGSWNRSSGRGLGDYKDDVQWTENNDSFFTYTFQGTGIDYITEVDEGQGNVEIYIDGVSQGNVSTYEAGAHNAPQRTVYTVRGLTNGFHTIKAVKKSGKFMLLDALRVQLPDLIDVSSTDFAKNAPADVSVNLLASPDSLSGIYNGGAALVRGTDYTIDDHVLTIKLQYLAAQPVGTTKLTLRFRGDYGDDAHASAAEGAAFSYTFKGTGIELLSPVGPKQGEMEVYIDGELKKTVNAYADSRDSQVSLYSVSGLTAGSHTIRVVNKSGELMLADALRFTAAEASVPPVSGGGGNATPPVEPAAPKVIRTTQPDGTVRDELTLAATEAKALIDARKASGASALKLVVPDSKGQAAETAVKLDAEAVKQLAASGLDLDIDVSGAKIHVPNAVLKNVNTEVHFVISPVNEKKAQLERRANLSTVVSAAVKDSKITLIGIPADIDTNLPEGETTLVLPLPAGDWSSEALSHIGVFIEHSDGTVEYKQGTVVDVEGGKGIQFKNSKFSTFALVKLGEASGSASAAYMNGFDGNLFKPEKAITRAEMATILSRIAQDATVGEDSRAYSDVKQGYWAADAIRKATAAGLMNGYTDGTFRPEKAITRAEMAQLAVRLAGGGSKLGAGFADTTGHWAEQAVKAAEGAGYIKGYADGMFRPDRTLSRAEAVVVINRSLGITPSGSGASSWKDVPASYWAYGDIEAASIQK
ncbi:X2-like carbohydrate binding domain-containing protein [Paenibacillus glycanilyticus]|uniref:X2-like carbohydrate binding domain-containing protein n=1 Tax=Paenibacillus glycanilyticus TaxID=126569 RepID=UPI003EB6BDF5